MGNMRVTGHDLGGLNSALLVINSRRLTRLDHTNQIIVGAQLGNNGGDPPLAGNKLVTAWCPSEVDVLGAGAGGGDEDADAVALGADAVGELGR